MENGIITNSTLKGNQDVINAQGVGAISSFMSNGAQTCDAQGQNCHSLFGGDDSIDYGSITSMGNTALGTAAQSFMNDGDGTSVSVQTGAITLACGNTQPQTVAGVAVKVSGCQVNSSGDAQVQLSVCTAPMRGLPTTSPANAVPCSSNPSDPSYFPPAGSVCQKASCDTEPVGSLNGWSPTKTLIFQANATGLSADQQTKNGLALVFYPDLAAGVVPSFTADSDSMTAVKIVQTFTNASTGQQAVGLKVAYRQKTTITKDQFVDGANTVGDPSRYTSAWNSLEKLAVNPLIPQYQTKIAQDSRAGLTKLQDGIKKGQVEVFDPNYVGPESGVKPIATTAKIAAAGEGCGTTAECLKWVTNTNTWTQTCQAAVPLSMRSCSTVTDYTKEDIISVRTRSQEVCREARTSAQYECQSQAQISTVNPYQGLGSVPVQQTIYNDNSPTWGLTVYPSQGIIQVYAPNAITQTWSDCAYQYQSDTGTWDCTGGGDSGGCTWVPDTICYPGYVETTGPQTETISMYGGVTSMEQHFYQSEYFKVRSNQIDACTFKVDNWHYAGGAGPGDVHMSWTYNFCVTMYNTTYTYQNECSTYENAK